MIANITHQFRQPLNNISYIFNESKKKDLKIKVQMKYILIKKVEQAK